MPHNKLPRDSVMAYIPLSVTADLGVAMQRVRAKRIAKIKQLCPSLFKSESNKSKDIDNSKNDGGASGSVSQQSNVDESENEGYQDRSGGRGDGNDNDNDGGSEKREISNTGIRREQFGSVVEYLEAKYARGVTIDLDEKIKERKKQKKMKKTEEEEAEGGDGDGDDMSVLSDSAAGSCYSMDSGNFIDDSGLRKEVAHQILGSSAFGKTKIEARGGGYDDNSMVGDDDHGFFVNIGDLEMEDGWTEHDLDDDEDWMKMMAKAKGKKRKRSTKDSTVKESEKTKKKVKKSQTNHDEKNKKKNPSSDVKKSKSSPEKKKINKPKPQTKEKLSKPQEKVVKAVPSNDGGDDQKKTETKAAPKKEISESRAKINEAKKECTNLKRRITRLYKKCVEEIKNMTAENLPRKSKKGAKSKVSIIVPDGKKTGDKISFNNPHDPSQKLQVLIPDKYEAGQTFKVSVPMPTVSKTSTNAENKFSKECINVLDEYSLVYDEWCQAEAKYREMIPNKKKLGEFKVGTERLKKYDQMLEQFPKNLETPVDAPFLRKVVRRKRQNENKRLKLMEESGKKVETVKVEKKKKREPVLLSLNLPCKGQKFPEVEFKMKDFEQRKKDS